VTNVFLLLRIKKCGRPVRIDKLKEKYTGPFLLYGRAIKGGKKIKDVQDLVLFLQTIMISI
jgi:hypothetical protein